MYQSISQSIHRLRQLIMGSALATLAVTSAHAANICSQCSPTSAGDLLHRASGIDAAFVGHAGVLLAPGQIADVTLRGPGKALDTVNMSEFLADNEFWGAKKHRDLNFADDDARSFWQLRLKDKFEYLKRAGVTYDSLHGSQKGTKRDPDNHLLFDCVGFVEHVLEYLGHNPTPDSYEVDAGWPLTPREQRDSTNLKDA